MDKQKYLLVCDLQDVNSEGVTRFTKKLCDWIDAHAHEYVAVYATVRQNSYVGNFEKYLKDYSCVDPKLLPFHCERVLRKEGYGLDEIGYNALPKNAHIDVVGMETGGTVMNIALDLFSLNYDFSVLSDYCFCNDGGDVHKAACKVLNTYIGTALR